MLVPTQLHTSAVERMLYMSKLGVYISSCSFACNSVFEGFGLSAGGAFWPVFLIANVAALIASRAMTTATFSCIRQSTALGCFPRLKIIHTSRKFMGQIYIPVLNWFLLAFTIALVCSISNIYEIGNAYGKIHFNFKVTSACIFYISEKCIWFFMIAHTAASRKLY